MERVTYLTIIWVLCMHRLQQHITLTELYTVNTEWPYKTWSTLNLYIIHKTYEIKTNIFTGDNETSV